MDKIDPVSRPSASKRVRDGTEACVGQTLCGDEEITAARQRSVSEGVVNSRWDGGRGGFSLCVSI